MILIDEDDHRTVAQEALAKAKAMERKLRRRLVVRKIDSRTTVMTDKESIKLYENALNPRVKTEVN